MIISSIVSIGESRGRLKEERWDALRGIRGLVASGLETRGFVSKAMDGGTIGRRLAAVIEKVDAAR
jgi:hypothetical protein